ncbi:MAG: pilus assembly protein [Actinomycetes bacterium]
MRRLRRASAGDAGSAVVEFVTLGVLLLVPVVYLVITLGRVQAGVFAAEGAAREAARAFTAAEDEGAGAHRARAAVLLAFHDQGFRDADPARSLVVDCEEDPCLQPEARVRVEVTLDVVLPGVPRFVDAVVPTRVPVSAEALAVVDRFRG